MELYTSIVDNNSHAIIKFARVGWNCRTYLVITPLMRLRVTDGTLKLRFWYNLSCNSLAGGGWNSKAQHSITRLMQFANLQVPAGTVHLSFSSHLSCNSLAYGCRMELLTAASDTTFHAINYFTGVGWNSEPHFVITSFMQFTSLWVSDGALNVSFR